MYEDLGSMNMSVQPETVPQSWVNCPRASEEGSRARGSEKKNTLTENQQLRGRHRHRSSLSHRGDTYDLNRKSTHAKQANGKRRWTNRRRKRKGQEGYRRKGKAEQRKHRRHQHHHQHQHQASASTVIANKHTGSFFLTHAYVESHPFPPCLMNNVNVPLHAMVRLSGIN